MEKFMKTTRKKLLKIIKEELNKVLGEAEEGEETIFSKFLDDLKHLAKDVKRNEAIIAFEQDIGMSWAEYLKGVGEYVVEQVTGNRPGVLGYGSDFLEGGVYLPVEVPWWTLTHYFGKPEKTWNIESRHEPLLEEISFRWSTHFPIKIRQKQPPMEPLPKGKNPDGTKITGRAGPWKKPQWAKRPYSTPKIADAPPLTKTMQALKKKK